MFNTLGTTTLPPVISVKRELPYVLESSTSSTDSDSSDDRNTPFYFSDTKRPLVMSYMSPTTEPSKSHKSASEQPSIPLSFIHNFTFSSSSSSSCSCNTTTSNYKSMSTPTRQKPISSSPTNHIPILSSPTNNKPISSPSNHVPISASSNQKSISTPSNHYINPSSIPIPIPTPTPTPTPTPRTQKPNSNSLLTFVKLFVASSHGTLPSSPTKQDIEFLNCCRFVAYALNNRSISNLRSTFGEFARSKYYYSPLLVRTAALKRMLKVRDYFGTPEIMSIYSNPCCLRTKPTTEENTIQRQVVYAVCKNTYNEFDFRVLKSFIKEGNVVNKYSKQTTC